MKLLLRSRKELQSAGRWDIDFHLPAEGILKFPKGLLKARRRSRRCSQRQA